MLVNQAKQWNEVAKRWPHRTIANELLAEHKRKIYLGLLARWAEVNKTRLILETDLFAEAFGLEQFLFDVAEANGKVVGIDISNQIVAQAKKQAAHYEVDATRFLCCDVRNLPFPDNVFDLVISISTLDHFHSEIHIITAIRELRRVLRVGGTLILTIDNKSNLTYPPYIFVRLWMLLGLAPYFIGKSLSRQELRHILEESGFYMADSTAIFHYPHPDCLVRWLESSLCRLSKGKFDNAIRKCLDSLDRLEGKRSQYLTGRYLAVKAVKREIS